MAEQTTTPEGPISIQRTKLAGAVLARLEEERRAVTQQFSFCPYSVTKGQIALPRPVVAIKAREAEVW